ncbi:ribonuclease HI family protein [Candidatus Dependentiae bacterium]|nr:ribonuclease HI family protein [Candidatus Dependentiae bacterium]
MSLENRRILTIHVDGASRGNPGTSGIGIYCTNQEGRKIINAGFMIQKLTNNQAEYLALVYALFFLTQKLSPSQQKQYFLKIFADSQLLIKQMNGEYKIKDPTLKILANIIKGLSFNFICSFTHVLREFNATADELANHGIDSKKQLDAEFVSFLARNNFVLVQE